MTTTSLPNAAPQSCPQCTATIWNDAGFVNWCQDCDWNIQPQKEQEGRLSLLYGQLGQRMSRGLFDSAVKAKGALTRPALTMSSIVALAIAACVHLITLAFAGLGLLLVIRGWPHIGLAVLGVLCLAVAILVRPRFARMPKDRLTRAQCPALYALLDEIAAAVGARQVHSVTINTKFNASFVQIGPARKAVVSIGLPLFVLLDGQEKVALAAHELAHGVNGDPMRGFVIGSAFESLFKWADLIRPDRIFEPAAAPSFVGAIASILMIPVNIGLLGLSYLIALVARGLVYLVFRDSQRAEYLADGLAARVSGVDPMLSTLEKMYYASTVQTVTRQAALNQKKHQAGDVFAALKSRVATLPTREIERLRRINLRDGARMDSTHPPTSYRVAVLRSRQATAPQVILSADREAQIERELTALAPKIQAQMISDYQHSLYY